MDLDGRLGGFEGRVVRHVSDDRGRIIAFEGRTRPRSPPCRVEVAPANAPDLRRFAQRKVLPGTQLGESRAGLAGPLRPRTRVKPGQGEAEVAAGRCRGKPSPVTAFREATRADAGPFLRLISISRASPVMAAARSWSLQRAEDEILQAVVVGSRR